MKLNLLLVFSLGLGGTSATAESAQMNKSLHSSSYSHLDGTKTTAIDATLSKEEFSGVKVVVDADVDDDYDELVLLVIDENPPEEQGIRPEWADRVGWHRKEDIYNTQHDDNEGPADKTDDNEDLTLEPKHIFRLTTDKEDELQKLLATKTVENKALKARLAEVDAKAKIHADKVDELRELLADKTDENEALKAKLDEFAKAWLDEVDAKAKIHADREGELRELVADKMKENEALKARLAEVESKNSWFDTNDQQNQKCCEVFGKDRPGCMWMLKCLDIMVNRFAWVTQFVDPEPICDTFSYAKDLIDTYAIDIDFVDSKRRSD